MLAERQMSGIATDTDVSRLRLALARIARCLRALDATSGLTPTQTSVLFAIRRHGSIGLAELAAYEGLNATLLSRVVGLLSREGLIVRSPAPGDRRAALVELTDEGRARCEEIRDRREAALGREVDALDARSRDALLAALPVLEELAERLR
jgi:DNA-binding MarR family transcriptional regulator